MFFLGPALEMGICNKKISKKSVVGKISLVYKIFFITEQVSPADPSMEWKDITDRAATSAFWLELIRGKILICFHCGKHNIME